MIDCYENKRPVFTPTCIFIMIIIYRYGIGTCAIIRQGYTHELLRATYQYFGRFLFIYLMDSRVWKGRWKSWAEGMASEGYSVELYAATAISVLFNGRLWFRVSIRFTACNGLSPFKFARLNNNDW